MSSTRGSSNGRSPSRKFSVTEYVLGSCRRALAVPLGGMTLVWKSLLLPPWRIGVRLLRFPFLLGTFLGFSGSKFSHFYKTTRPKYTVKEYALGVWKLKVAVPAATLFDVRRFTQAFSTTAPLLWRLAVDVFRISPRLMTIYIATRIWDGMESPIQVYLNSKLMRVLEAALVARSVGDGRAIIYALAAHLLVTGFAALASWYETKISDMVATKVHRHFHLLSLKRNLDVDLAASKEHSSQSEGGEDSQVWGSVQNISSFLSFILRALAELGVIVNISHTAGGPLFVLMCVAYPMAGQLFSQTHSQHECLAYTTNDDYHRLEALENMADTQFKQDVIANGLGGWIAEQYEQTAARLENVPIIEPFRVMHMPIDPYPYWPIALSVLGELPIIFCAANALLHPDKFSVASLAILQRSALSLHMSTRIILYSGKQFLMSVALVKKMYAPPGGANRIKDGTVAYPRDAAEERADGSDQGEPAGMGFELRNVSFSYPGTQSTVCAISALDLTIQPGALIVIVGANGSGKSTLVRLLARLYDPSSGEVRIDGLSSSDYCVADLHRATALLSQDGVLYPLSLRENIGLGYPGLEENNEMIEEAARLGGATEVIGKLQGGLSTMLDPGVQLMMLNLRANEKDHPLVQELDALPKKIDVSGGEKQRIVAARTFMRFNSGAVRFVAVDEPSSALDAEGELKLFENLIAARKGKTMVFVTHRFGHLTRHADKIICLKDGVVVEEGLHDQLINHGGEYANLYNIQAAAFTN